VSPMPELAKTQDDIDDVDADSVASTAQVLLRLEKDLLRLRRSLSAHDGLLIVINGPRFGSLFVVNHHITTIGRDPICDVWLNELTVSRRHAEIYRDGDKFTFCDVNSKNGSYISNVRIRSSLLRSYDELKIGRLRLLFVQGGNGKERFQSPRYDPVRSRLIQDSVADTSAIAPLSLSNEDHSVFRVSSSWSISLVGSGSAPKAAMSAGLLMSQYDSIFT
jgi:predicted component of type VI protein secretion system